MIASKCILSNFLGNDVSRAPVTKARGRVAIHLQQRCGKGGGKAGQEVYTAAGLQEGTGSVPSMKWKVRQSHSLPSYRNFDPNVAANLTCFKTGSIS